MCRVLTRGIYVLEHRRVCAFWNRKEILSSDKSAGMNTAEAKKNGINDTRNKHFNLKTADPSGGNMKHKDFCSNFPISKGKRIDFGFWLRDLSDCTWLPVLR